MAEDPIPQTQFVAPSLEDLAPLFPAYELLDFIAQGGMGAVYRARQKSLDRTVAIKILPREFGDDQQFREAFEAEAKAMARLNHPNLIAVYDFGDIEGMLYIIMEFVDGKALYYSAHGKTIDPAVALGLVATISRGLGNAHRGGIVHRDIKPANILLDANANPKVGDFGLARPLDRDRSEGIVLGTPGYTAPEVYTREFKVDQRSDIFSVGALLYELLCGKQPEPHSTSMKSGVDPRIDALLAKATHANPNHRYLDVEDFANDLEALIPKLSGPRFATAATSPGTAPPAPLVQPLASSKKSSALPVVLILALLGGAGALAYKMMQSKDTPPATLAPEVEKEEKPRTEKREKREKPLREKKAVVEKPVPTKPEPVAPVIEEKPAETPRQALARLRKDLARGERTNFPPTAVKKDDSTFFLIAQKMTWHQAREFAESHGAQLANLKSPEALQWAESEFKKHLPLWLGASDSGTEKKWFWDEGLPVNEALWAESEPNNSTATNQDGEDFAILSQSGPRLEDAPAEAENAFLLEWKNDGAQPGAIDRQLQRTAEALSQKKPPVFPTGTFNVGGARFLLVKRQVDWETASQMARDGGGHLAVLSNPNEAAFAHKLILDQLPADASCWLGASRNESAPEVWETVTGELFDFVSWLPGQPDHNDGGEPRLVLLRQADQVGANDEEERSQATRHLLIEWSVPSLQNLPDENALPSGGADVSEVLDTLRAGVRDRHGQGYRKFRRKYDKAVEDFLDNAISTINNETRLPAPLRAEYVEYFQGFKESNALPDSLPRRAPDAMQRELTEAREESAKASEEYQADFEIAKADYLETLATASAAAFAKSATETGKVLTLEAQLIEKDAERFHKIMNNDKIPLPADEPAVDEGDNE
ncbi:protein kinase [Verrucomicrobiaceae bacterium 227]